MQAARGTSPPNGTEQLIRTIFEQLERATSAAVDPGVSFGAKGTLLILGSDAKGTLLIALGERREEDIANCSGKLNDLGKSAFRRLGILPQELRVSPLFVSVYS